MAVVAFKVSQAAIGELPVEARLKKGTDLLEHSRQIAKTLDLVVEEVKSVGAITYAIVRDIESGETVKEE